jgi:hypothetical protein
MINKATAATTHDLRVSTDENVDCSMNCALRAVWRSSPTRTYRRARFAATRNEESFRLAGSRLSMAHSRLGGEIQNRRIAMLVRARRSRLTQE